MKILLVAHAGWRKTGYGAPVMPLARQLQKAEHEVVVLAVEERGPAMLDYYGVRHYAPLRSRYGDDILPAIAEAEGVQAVISLIDPWATGARGYASTSAAWYACCAIDQEPLVPGLRERLELARLVMPFSKWGAGVVRRALPDARVCVMPPSGVDLSIYQPLDAERRASMRAALGCNADDFVVGLFGANSPGDRKALAEQIIGWAIHARNNPSARLLLWTSLTGGVDILALLETIGPVADRVIIGDQFRLAYGVNDEAMARLYNSLDVLSHASAAEGFGISIIQAQACGVPVIGARNTSMPELITPELGWLVEDTQVAWSPLSGYWNRPTPEGVAHALTRAHNQSASERRAFSECCRTAAHSYSWDAIGAAWAGVLE